MQFTFEVHFFAEDMHPIVLTPFAEKTTLFPLSCFYTSVKNQLAIFVCISGPAILCLQSKCLSLHQHHGLDYSGFIWKS